MVPAPALMGQGIRRANTSMARPQSLREGRKTHRPQRSQVAALFVALGAVPPRLAVLCKHHHARRERNERPNRKRTEQRHKECLIGGALRQATQALTTTQRVQPHATAVKLTSPHETQTNARKHAANERKKLTMTGRSSRAPALSSASTHSAEKVCSTARASADRPSCRSTGGEHSSSDHCAETGRTRQQAATTRQQVGTNQEARQCSTQWFLAKSGSARTWVLALTSQPAAMSATAKSAR